METKQSTSAESQSDVVTQLSAANSASEMTLTELMAKVKVFRQNMQANPGDVKNGDPRKGYAWVSLNPIRRVAFEALGYTVCKDPKVITNSLWKKEDGTHVRGDLILYEVPREQQQIISFSEQLDALERVDGAKETFKRLAKANRLTVIGD